MSVCYQLVDKQGNVVKVFRRGRGNVQRLLSIIRRRTLYQSVRCCVCDRRLKSLVRCSETLTHPPDRAAESFYPCNWLSYLTASSWPCDGSANPWLWRVTLPSALAFSPLWSCEPYRKLDSCGGWTYRVNDSTVIIGVVRAPEPVQRKHKQHTYD